MNIQQQVKKCGFHPDVERLTANLIESQLFRLMHMANTYPHEIKIAGVWPENNDNRIFCEVRVKIFLSLESNIPLYQLRPFIDQGVEMWINRGDKNNVVNLKKSYFLYREEDRP